MAKKIQGKYKKLLQTIGLIMVLALAYILLNRSGLLTPDQTEESRPDLTISQTETDTSESKPQESTADPAEESRKDSETSRAQEAESKEEETVVKGQAYSSKEEVAQYLHLYGELPPNFLTKKEAETLGWDSREGNLWDVTDHMSIGGDVFGNREGRLPKKSGRKWYECDIDYEGGFRGAKRILYSSDGLIYYTEDHYETFERLY